MQRNLSKDCRICQNSIRDCSKRGISKIGKLFACVKPPLFFDVVFLLATIEDTISFVAAKELWHYPILSRYLDSIGCVALERGAKKLETIKSNIVSMHQALAKGNLVLFLEGECSYYDEQMHKFRKGGFIGLDAKQPIVPVYIKPERLSSIGRWIVPKGRVAVFIGSFFSPSEVEKGTPTAAKIADMARDEILALRQMSEG